MKIAIIFILVMLALGAIGQRATAGYHCHYARVGDSTGCL